MYIVHTKKKPQSKETNSYEIFYVTFVFSSTFSLHTMYNIRVV